MGGLAVAYKVNEGGALKRRDEFRSSREVERDYERMRAIPQRAKVFERLASEEYDILVVGGGATGSSVALDAATRGYRVALVECEDVASGTSSRSTKLIHGGVRYLQKAVFELDPKQLLLVTEALRERAHLLRVAPHLTRELPIALPVYDWWRIPYFMSGLVTYDALAGREALHHCYFMRAGQVLAEFPDLRAEGLAGAVVYHDGQHDDARMALAMAQTAAGHGADVATYAEAEGLLLDENGRVCGARVRDVLGGRELRVRAKAVVNATGVFTDSLRRMANPTARDLVVASDGVHVMLRAGACSRKMGLLTESSDGRVLFLLPWQGRTLAGTTDGPSEPSRLPKPRAEDVRFVIGELRQLLAPQAAAVLEDVRSTWAGFRPLVQDPAKPDTQSLARTHVVLEDKASGLITVTGGKWTTCRHMAEDAVNAAARALPPAAPCRTQRVMLYGGHNWSPSAASALAAKFSISPELADHLDSTYGDRAAEVLTLAHQHSLLAPLADGHMPIEAEVLYAAQHEWAMTSVDVLARRTRLLFIDVDSAKTAYPKVSRILAKHHNWSRSRRQQDEQEFVTFLNTVNVGVL